MQSAQLPAGIPTEQNRSGWVRRLITATWQSFSAKLVAALAFIASVTGLLTFALGASLSPNIRSIGVFVSGAALLGLTVFYIARALVTLAREGERLARETDTAWRQVESLNDEKAEWQKEEGTPSRAARLASAMYGMVYYLHNLECSLHHDGSFLINSKLTMASTCDGITAIEHHVFAPHAPEDWDEVIQLKAEDKDDRSVLLKAETLDKTAKLLYWQLKAMPEFKRGHRIEYSFSEKLPARSFAMTLEDMQARHLEWEYFYVRITYPTEHLHFSVTLPADYLPEKRDFDVWFGWQGQVRHVSEYNRLATQSFWQVNRLPRQNQLQLQLDFMYPVQGLYYAIKWRPPC